MVTHPELVPGGSFLSGPEAGVIEDPEVGRLVAPLHHVGGGGHGWDEARGSVHGSHWWSLQRNSQGVTAVARQVMSFTYSTGVVVNGIKKAKGVDAGH